MLRGLEAQRSRCLNKTCFGSMFGAFQIGPRAAKRVQEHPKNGQEGPKISQERPKSGQERPKGGQEVPKTTLRAAKRAPRSAKSTSRAAKRPPRAPQERPRGLQDQPTASLERPRGPQDQPRGLQERPRAILLIFHWFYQGLAAQLPRHVRQHHRGPEPWRGVGGRHKSLPLGFRGGLVDLFVGFIAWLVVYTP